MSDGLEAVLRRVAAGELTPEAALRLLSSEPGAPESAPEPPPVFGTPPELRPESKAEQVADLPVTAIRLHTSYRSVEVVADPTVARLHVTGSHTVEAEAGALVVTTTGPLDEQERDPSRTDGRFSFSDLPKTIAWARSWREHQLTIRINPELALELDCTGTDLKVTGCAGGISGRLVASSLRGDQVSGPLGLDATSSSIKLSAVPTGESRLKAESSSVRLSLEPGADLAITATNRMGRLALLDQPVTTLPFEGETAQARVGEGRYRLQVDCVMSSVTVTSRAWAPA